MKGIKFLFGAAAIAMMASCGSKPKDAYTVTGEVEGLDGQTVYLSGMTGDPAAVDSTVIESGKFVFTGNTEKPTQVVLFVGDIHNPDTKQYVRFFVEPAEITLTGLKAGDFSDAVVTGSKTSDEQQAYEKSLKSIYEEMMSIRQQMEANAENKAVVDSLTARGTELQAQGEGLQAKFIAENPGSYYTPTLLRMAMSRMTYDELKKTYEGLNPEIQEAASEVKAELDALEAVQPGKPAPDLVGVNHKGEPEKLSDLKGKVVLLDFWATWCGPCRAALPHVNELYKKYHDKGFEVFCIGDNDTNPDQWKEFIETSKDGMADYHHILRGLKQNKDENGKFIGFDDSADQSKKYAVHYLPTKYLIAADGTIIGKFDDNEALDAKLAEIFK